jgi:sugar lactone lactonase YvrE
MNDIQVLCDVRNRVGESPLWSVSEQALYWVDIDGRRLHRFDWATRREEGWSVPERIACIVLHAAGGLLAAMETGLFHLRPQPGSEAIGIEKVQAASFPRPDMRFNDGRCDREGRLWVSSMVLDMSLACPAGALFRYDGRELVPVLDGLITGNGLGFSPDGRTMYLSDSHPSVQRIWAFDLDEHGTPTNRREFIDMNAYPGRPDGAAVDTEGGYWICGNDAGCIHRFTPEGKLDHSIALPLSKPSMCAFGGPGLEHLFVTSIRPAQPVAGFDASLDGAVLQTTPGGRGIAETPFRPQ